MFIEKIKTDVGEEKEEKNVENVRRYHIRLEW